MQISREIVERTKEIAGNNQGISKEPIRILLTSSDIPDLELIDLPGFTRNPVGKEF